ncbi:MAG TPA: hypothetical protein VFI30_03515 [Nocardioidaceae bacterium]|nr:hypothetical protein [Nocardioidaceae bacterium]
MPNEEEGGIGASPTVETVTRQHAVPVGVIAVLLVVGCALATWWQARRALGGNLLSDFYVFMWPFYGCYVAVVWYRLRRDQQRPAGREGAPSASGEEPTTEDLAAAERLAAYNRFLAARRDDVQRRRR